MSLHRYLIISTFAILLGVLLFAGCASESDTGPTQVTTSSTTTAAPQPTAKANVTMSVARPEVVVTTQGNIFFVDLTIRETAGVGITLNFLRLDVFAATGAFVERQEKGSGVIIAETGSNRVQGNSARDLIDFWFLFRTHIVKGRMMRLTLGYGDDGGNANQTETLDFIFR